MSEKKNDEVEFLDEYDFSNAVIGKYAKQYAEGSNIWRVVGVRVDVTLRKDFRMGQD